MSEYIGHIDTNFDNYFIEHLKLPWLPWVGINFSDTKIKTLILGESTYNWDLKNEKVKKSLETDSHLRRLHYNHAINYKRKSKYVRNIERAIFQKKWPSIEDKENLWASVVYHNLVLSPMHTIRHRPDENDYSKGWAVCLDIIEEMQIGQCIVYGLEWKKIKALLDLLKSKDIEYKYTKMEDKVGRYRPKIISIDSQNVKIIFIRHPSSFFSWQKWGQFLNTQILKIENA